MTDKHPIIPPLSLVEELQDLGNLDAIQLAYQAGADLELNACCEWLQDPELNVDTYKLRAARRPKPPSLKEQALKDLDELLAIAKLAGIFNPPDSIRKALEALPND